MVNEEKVRLMFKAAVLEQRDLKKEMKVSGYSRAGYVSYHIIINDLCFSAAFLLVLVLAAVCRAGFFLSDDFLRSIKKQASVIILIYVMLLLAVSFATWFLARVKYDRFSSKLREYRESLAGMEDYYTSEKEGENAAADSKAGKEADQAEKKRQEKGD